MATASTLIADIQTQLGDTAKNTYTDALLLTWLDMAQREWVARLMPLRQVDGFDVSANQDSFAIPSDALMVEAVITRKGVSRKLKRVTVTDFINQQTAVQGAVATDPVIWTEMDGRIYVYPRYSGASKTSTLSAASLSTTGTTLTLTSTGNFRSYGRGVVDSEEFEYTGKTSTTLTGVRRGVAGTAAAAHASSATVTQQDLEVVYRRTAVALSSTTSPEIKSVWHEKLELYCIYLSYLKEGSLPRAQAIHALWQQALQEAEYIEKRESLENIAIRDFESQSIGGLYGPS